MVDKPAHLLVHPSKPGNPPTLLDGLVQLLAFELATGGQISIMNRLDRETSGIVLAAKHRKAATELGKAKVAGEFTKTYEAIIHGWPEADEFAINEPVLRKGTVEPSEIHVRQMVHPDGKPCSTTVSVLARFAKRDAKYSHVRCGLITGRMHQIRVHLEWAGHPLLGDKIYGHCGQAYLDFIAEGWTPKLAKQLILNRHALHACGLKWRDFHWKSPLPHDFGEILKK
ncbi:MAG: RNA pseudouridine synthase [Verrucomicrobiales bacterium]|nr:RNA pseudouridine synthase [Verrucomicrobiales bacterium]